MAKEFEDYLKEVLLEDGEPADWLAAQRTILTAATRLNLARHKVYGPGNISAFGLHGVIIRINDKLERLKRMVFGKSTDDVETMTDSLADGLNYFLIGLMVQQGWWELPVVEPESPPLPVEVPAVRHDGITHPV